MKVWETDRKGSLEFDRTLGSNIVKNTCLLLKYVRSRSFGPSSDYNLEARLLRGRIVPGTWATTHAMQNNVPFLFFLKVFGLSGLFGLSGQVLWPDTGKTPFLLEFPNTAKKTPLSVRVHVNRGSWLLAVEWRHSPPFRHRHHSVCSVQTSL